MSHSDHYHPPADKPLMWAILALVIIYILSTAAGLTQKLGGGHGEADHAARADFRRAEGMPGAIHQNKARAPAEADEDEAQVGHGAVRRGRLRLGGEGVSVRRVVRERGSLGKVNAAYSPDGCRI